MADYIDTVFFIKIESRLSGLWVVDIDPNNVQSTETVLFIDS